MAETLQLLLYIYSKQCRNKARITSCGDGGWGLIGFVFRHQQVSRSFFHQSITIRKQAKSEDQHFIFLIFPLFFSLCSFRFVSTSCFLFLCFLSWFPSCFCLFPTDLISSLLPSVPRVYYRHVNDGCVDVNHSFSDCFGLFQWSAVNSRENNNCTGDAL